MEYEAIINDLMLSDEELLTLAGIADNQINDEIENLAKDEVETILIDVLKALISD